MGPVPALMGKRILSNANATKGTRLRRMGLNAALAGQERTRMPEGLVCANRVRVGPTPSRGARRSTAAPVSLGTRLRRMVLSAPLARKIHTRIPQGVVHARCVRAGPAAGGWGDFLLRNAPVSKGTRLRRMALSAALARQGRTRISAGTTVVVVVVVVVKGKVYAHRVLLTPTPSRRARRSTTAPVSLVTWLQATVLGALRVLRGVTRHRRVLGCARRVRLAHGHMGLRRHQVQTVSVMQGTSLERAVVLIAMRVVHQRTRRL
jgi:hypothetical protein